MMVVVVLMKVPAVWHTAHAPNFVWLTFLWASWRRSYWPLTSQLTCMSRAPSSGRRTVIGQSGCRVSWPPTTKVRGQADSSTVKIKACLILFFILWCETAFTFKLFPFACYCDSFFIFSKKKKKSESEEVYYPSTAPIDSCVWTSRCWSWNTHQLIEM